MTPDDDDVRALTADACDAMLGLEARPAREPRPPGGACLRGRVALTGAFCGSVTLSCSPTFARLAAARMFGAPAGSRDEDARDALGELANVVGGGLKGLLPAPSRLSLPEVSESDDWREPGGPGAPRPHEVWFECDGERFVVALTTEAGPP